MIGRANWPSSSGYPLLQIAKQLEEARARVEEEVVATVRIATALEARLQAAHKSVANVEQNAAAAERRAIEVPTSNPPSLRLIIIHGHDPTDPGTNAEFKVWHDFGPSILEDKKKNDSSLPLDVASVRCLPQGLRFRVSLSKNPSTRGSSAANL